MSRRTAKLELTLLLAAAAALGIREADGPITDDASRFVAHRLVGWR